MIFWLLTRRGFICLFFVLNQFSVHAAGLDWSAWLQAEPRIKAATASYQAKLAEAEGAWSVYLPTLRGTGSAGNSRSQDPLTRDGRKHTFGLELEQPIPLFGRESARVELARVAARVEETELRRVEQAVVSELLESLISVNTAKSALALRVRLARNLAEQAIAVHAAVAGGGMKLTEARLIQSRVVQAQALRSRAEADLSAAQTKVKRLLPDTPAPTPLDADALRTWWQAALTQDAFEAAALQSAPALRKAQAEAEQAGAEYAVTRADLWPKLSVTLQAQKGSFGGVSADSRSVYFGVSVPLYEGGASFSRVDSAAHRHAAAQSRTEQERRMTLERVSEAWTRWQAAQLMAQAWQESEREEEESVKLTSQQLAGGATTQIGLFKAWQTLLETRLQGVDHRAQQDLAWLRLLHEAGALALPPTHTPEK